MNILLLGKDGQIGRQLQLILPNLGSLLSCGHHEADLQDLQNLYKLLHRITPDVIVNAAAYTAVDKAEIDREAAYKINAEAVEILAVYARHSNALLIHYSTDYVFDGEKPGPYVETDIPNPKNIYGRTKLAGENAIRESGCAALILRTSWVFSVHNNNFVKTILRLAMMKESLSIVADQFGSPTSAELIAEVTASLIERYRENSLIFGTYHMTAASRINWYEFAQYILRRAQKNGLTLQLDLKQLFPITTAESKRLAQRPRNSCMDTSRLSSLLGFKFPNWNDHVDKVIDQLIDQGCMYES